MNNVASRSGWVAVVLSVLSLAVLLPRTAAAQGLEDFAQSGRLATKVMETVDRAGWSDALLIIRADDIRGDGLAPAGRMGIQKRRQRYAARKAAVLDRAAPADVIVLQDYDHLPITYVQVDSIALDALLADEEVIAVAENATVYPTLAQSLPLISADIAHGEGYTGAGTSVAVLDTGVDYTRSAFGYCTAPGVPEETCKVVFAQDFGANDGYRDVYPYHGTNVAGIVLGTAPDTRILALDVFRSSGGSYDDILLAMNWVLANKDVYNIAAANLSMEERNVGYTAPCPTNALAPAITELKIAGILSAVASGNSGFTNKIAPPGCSPDAVSVGAVYDGGPVYNYTGCSESTEADKVVCFSNSAYFLSLLAPGAEIVAAGIALSGTSMATPHVAGAAAALKGGYPEFDLGVDEVAGMMRLSGVPITDHRNLIVTPRINLADAVNCYPGERVRIGISDPGWTYDGTLQGAYDGIGGNSAVFTIETHAYHLNQALNLNADRQVRFGEGYDCDFTEPIGGLSFLALTVSDGTAVFDGWPVTLKP